jgi:5-methylcytosine-specific restriction endonuclease McrA
MFQTQQFQLEQKSLILGLSLIGTPSLKYGGVSFIKKESAMNKTCSSCNKIKEINLFYKKSSSKDGHTSQCKECITSYHSKKKEEKREYDYHYRIRNRQRIKKVKDLYHLNNRELASDSRHTRRARLYKNGVFFVSKKELSKLYNSPCFYCGSLNKITIDHIIPISRGGTHGIGNLVAACAFCNGSKNKKFLMEWKRDLTFLKKNGKVE